MAQSLPFNVESIGEMADFLAGQLQDKFKMIGLETVYELASRDKEALAKIIENAIYNFEADLIGRFGSDQRFIELGEDIDETEDTEDTYHSDEDEIMEPEFLEEGDEWRR